MALTEETTDEVKSICGVVHTDAVKTAYAKHLEDSKPKE